MKIGCSSESFARSIEAGEMTQLEWLDACANELEVDGAVFALAHFPRTDSEYLAQIKKCCADLGLTVAGVSVSETLWSAGETALDIALAVGAPLVVAPAATAREDSGAWGAFTDAVKACARLAKDRNVTLAVKNAPGTLCTNGSDLRRLAKDIDSAWLRFAPDLSALEEDDAHALLAKSAIAYHTIANLETFATSADPEARSLIARLARYRAFTILERSGASNAGAAYHGALERFASVRSEALAGLKF